MRKEFVGAAPTLALSAELSSGSGQGATFSASGGYSNYPTGSNYPFVVVIGRGTQNQEKILCSSRNGNTFTIQQRGYDGTASTTHELGASVDHVLDSQTVSEANEHVHTDGNPHNTTAADVGAAEDNHSHTPAEIGAATDDHTHTLSELGAADENHLHTLSELGAADESHTHTAAEVGAAEDNHTHTAAEVGAAEDNHTHDEYVESNDINEIIAMTQVEYDGIIPDGETLYLIVD